MEAKSFPEGDFNVSAPKPGEPYRLEPVGGGEPIYAKLNPADEGLLSRWFKFAKLKGPRHIIYNGGTIIDVSSPQTATVFKGSKDRSAVE